MWGSWPRALGSSNDCRPSPPENRSASAAFWVPAGRRSGISVFILPTITVPKIAVPNVAPIERVSCVIEVTMPRSSREVAFWTIKM